MKIKNLIFTLILFVAASISCLAQGTAFTYQGRLNANGNVANGLYDFRFRLDADPQGNTVLDTILTNSIGVTNGLFTTTLDYGGGWFNGSNYWLEVDVRTNNPGNTLGYSSLSPLQLLTPTPYAIFANTASNVSGPVSAAQLSGPIPAGQLSGTYSGAVSFNNANNSFAGNGGNVTNVNAAMLNGLTAMNFWQTGGNAGTSAGINFAGTTDSNAFEIHVDGIRAFRVEPDSRGSDAGNIIGGDPSNAIVQPGSGGDFIGGGGLNGGGNIIGSNSSGVFIGAGSYNQAGPNVNDSVISGGQANQIFSKNSVIAGGYDNTIQTNSGWSIIGGGYYNNILPYAYVCTIAGGYYNSIQGDSNAWFSDQPGGQTIGGGFANNILADSDYATIAGGFGNTIRTNSGFTFIGGGIENSIQTNAEYAAIGGGYYNEAAGIGAFIGGGGTDGSYEQGNVASGNASVIGGGVANQATNGYSVTGGGYGNISGGYESFVGAGYNNIASGGNSFIGDGLNNTASGSDAFIGGGNGNSAAGNFAAVLGGNNNTASADYSLAAGNNAIASHQGVFVWADSNTNIFNPFTQAGNIGIQNSFNVRSTGGFYIVTGINATNGNVTSEAYLNPGATSWATMSDRNAKKDFTPVDCLAVLAKLAGVPIQRWHYKWEDDSDVLNIGPMAQDFKHAFYPGRDDKSITTLEFDGVELAAIEGLNQKVDEKDAKIQEQSAEIADLKTRLQKLEQLVTEKLGDAK
jgi:hypothetical protein